MRVGYTLIEVLVVVFIILLLTGGSLAAFGTFSKSSTLKQSGLNLKNTLREAQSKAFTGEKDCTRCNCTDNDPTDDYTLIGWRVNFSDTSYTIYGTCKNPLPTPSYYPFPTKTISLPSDIIIPTSVPKYVEFFYYPKMANRPDDNGNICLKQGSDYYKLYIEQSGNIVDSGVQSVCP